MGSRIKGLVKAFGWADGLVTYVRVKYRPSRAFFLTKYDTSFHLRPGTSDYYTFDQVFIQNQYDIELPFAPKTILDAGANVGLSAAYFAHRFPDASIVAVEPDKSNFETLQKNVRKYPQVKPLCMGLWNKDALLKITNARECSHNSFMVSETNAADSQAIPAISIQSIMAQNGWDTIDILKIDIEGSEKEVFGADYEQWLPKTKAIFIELHDIMRRGCSTSVFKAISRYNFSFEMCHENLVFINQDLVAQDPGLANKPK